MKKGFVEQPSAVERSFSDEHETAREHVHLCRFVFGEKAQMVAVEQGAAREKGREAKCFAKRRPKAWEIRACFRAKTCRSRL
jgi:hypothetical protein